jgi:2-polyprenyl-6-hydroxyphenyl methylase/3-demethylubiquinone-9 3-methyltransferase
MKRIFPEETWLPSWSLSYGYDLEEIYGEISNRGYAFAYQQRKKQTLRLISEVVPPASRILDIAAAQGNFSLALAEMGYDVTWNDLRAELAGYVKLKYETGKITFAPGNAFELDFPAPFDAVVATEIIEHVAHPDEFLKTVAKLVKPGGHIVMTTPNGAYLKNNLPKFSDCPDPSAYESVQFKPNSDGHIFLLHPSEIPTLASHAGVDIDSLTLFTNPLTNGHLKMEPLLHVLPQSVVQSIERTTQALPFSLRQRALLQMGIRFRKHL